MPFFISSYVHIKWTDEPWKPDVFEGLDLFGGQKNIKKLSEFADLSTDELVGGYDEVKGKKIRIEGYLEEFSLSRKEADQLIMSAREIVYK